MMHPRYAYLVRLGCIAVLFLLAGGTRAQQDSLAAHYAGTITINDLRRHLDTLASDAYMGRETGREGQRMAARYIKRQFRADGIPPIPYAEERGMLADGYQQQFPLVVTKPGGLSLEVAGEPYAFMRDLYFFSRTLEHDVDARQVMVATPLSLGGMRLGGGSDVVMLLDPQQEGDDLFERIKKTRLVLEGTGTQVLLMVDDSAASVMRRYGPFLNHGRMRLDVPEENKRDKEVQVIMITPELANTILEKGNVSMKKVLRTAGRKRVVVHVPVKVRSTPVDEKLTATNVLGYVEGSDKKGEIIFVTAHYDHIGVIGGEVYNGADDDGSGTAAVLEMAQAFAQAKAEGHGPRRSMVFMTVSGEEKGLLGSEWYTDHPVFPLDSTMADLNIDMIGRTDTVYGDSSKYVYVIGSKRISTELGETIEKQNALWTGLDLDYTFDSDSDPNRFYYRSDHYNFAKHGVPIAFFFNGVHADYHGPKDEVDKIRFDLLHQRALLVFHTAWVLANQEPRLVVDHPVPAR
jgi:hypothetical protein